MTRSLGLACAIFLVAVRLPRLEAQYPTPAIIPPNPLYQHPAYRYQFYLGTSVPTVYGRTFIGITVPYTRAPQLFSPNMGIPAPYIYWGITPQSLGSASYISGSTTTAAQLATQRAFQTAQAAAARLLNNPDAAQRVITAQAEYEKAAVVPSRPGLPSPPAAEALVKALSPPDEGDIISGQALNLLIQAVRTIDLRAAQPAAAFLPPQLLQELRFATPKGELLNLARQAKRLPFPEVLNQESLRPIREALERDLAAVALPLLAGKSPERAAIAQLENTLARLEQAATPIVRSVTFDEALSVRRFLNQLHSALRTLKSETLGGLWNPNWNTQGTNVAELAQHLLKHQLTLAPAPMGGEPAYLALHRALVAYFLAGQKNKK
ncbi:MAG: hypothetical protein NZU63_05350 [Gemmataceae bacterium]|nr:hypothetical protein [Gemmataceae bacterium]MDW8243404.1 hypothetical protein [Thermogemmata sp.]